MANLYSLDFHDDPAGVMFLGQGVGLVGCVSLWSLGPCQSNDDVAEAARYALSYALEWCKPIGYDDDDIRLVYVCNRTSAEGVEGPHFEVWVDTSFSSVVGLPVDQGASI